MLVCSFVIVVSQAELMMFANLKIMAAEIAFDKKPLYDRYAPGQISFDEAIKWAIEDLQRADDKDVKDVSKTAVLTSREMEP
jgi:hypothetical protein